MRKNCPQCGHSADEETRFCSKCGYEYFDWEEDRDSDQPISDARIGEYLIEDINRFVDRRSEVYVDKFTQLEYGASKRSFNWCAAFFGASWTGYRLMVGETFLYILLGIAEKYIMVFLSICVALLSHSTALSVLTAIVLMVLTFIIEGYLGDWLYWRYVRRKLNSCGCKGRPAFENDYKNWCLAEGNGATGWGIVGAMIANMLVTLIIEGLLGLF